MATKDHLFYLFILLFGITFSIDHDTDCIESSYGEQCTVKFESYGACGTKIKCNLVTSGFRNMVGTAYIPSIFIKTDEQRKEDEKKKQQQEERQAKQENNGPHVISTKKRRLKEITVSYPPSTIKSGLPIPSIK